MSNRVYTQTFVVVGAILERDGKILLVREAEGHAKGLWNQPAGWVDVGEDPIEAVKREVLEESGYHFIPKKLLGVYSLVVTRDEMQHHAVKLIFTGEIDNLEHPESTEADISETRWFSFEAIEAMDASTLRDLDIKQEVRDYRSGQGAPISFIKHSRQ